MARLTVIKKAWKLFKVVTLVLIGLQALSFLAWPTNSFPAKVLQAIRDDPNTVYYSLNPRRILAMSSPEDQAFHGFPIIGGAVLHEGEDRRSLVRNMRFRSWFTMGGNLCSFAPRHGVRASGPQGTYDVAICFQCGASYVYLPDGTKRRITVAGPPGMFDRLLEKHNVPMAPKY